MQLALPYSALIGIHAQSSEAIAREQEVNEVEEEAIWWGR